MFAPFSNRGPPGVTSGLVMYVMLPTGYLGTMAATNKGQGANLLETRGRDVLSDRAIEVS